jgi:hypothetical protein
MLIGCVTSFETLTNMSTGQPTIAFMANRFSTKQLLFAVSATSIAFGAFARGSYLLGSGAGLLYAFVALGASYILGRTLFVNRNSSNTRKLVTISLIVVVFVVLAAPSYFNSYIGRLIAGYRSEHETQAKLSAILARDPQFNELTADCRYNKCIVVTLEGRIEDESDLLRLRDLILDQCPDVSSRWLIWRVEIIKTGVEFNDCDLSIYGEMP